MVDRVSNMHEFLIPVLTGISLLLSGILIGYFLWFRVCNEKTALCQQQALDKECLTSQFREAASQAAEARDQLLRRDARSDHLQILCNDLLASREKVDQHGKKLESELSAARRQLESFSTQFVNEVATLNAALESEREQNRTFVCERDQAIKDHDELQTMINGLNKRSENQESTIRILRSRLEEKLCGLSTKAESQLRLQNGMAAKSHQAVADAQARIQRLVAENQDLQFKYTTLTKKYAELQQSGLRNESVLKRVSEENEKLQREKLRRASHDQVDQENWKIIANELQIRIDSVLRQRDSALDQLRALTDENNRITNHSRANEDTIRNLRRERGAVLMRNRQPLSQFPRIHAAPKVEYSDADLLSQEYGGPTRIDPIRGVVFIGAPRVRDDLKKICGVANVLEQRLNASGIYAYPQIMKWDEKAIREFSELLVFKDRIYRDDWLGQAARLYQQKQRAAVA